MWAVAKVINPRQNVDAIFPETRGWHREGMAPDSLGLALGRYGDTAWATSPPAPLTSSPRSWETRSGASSTGQRSSADSSHKPGPPSRPPLAQTLVPFNLCNDCSPSAPGSSGSAVTMDPPDCPEVVT